MTKLAHREADKEGVIEDIRIIESQFKCSGESEIAIYQPLHITPDKEEIKDFLKFAYHRTAFIRKTLGEIVFALFGSPNLTTISLLNDTEILPLTEEEPQVLNELEEAFQALWKRDFM